MPTTSVYDFDRIDEARLQQLQATKRRVYAELVCVGIAKVVIAYGADTNGSGNMIVTGLVSESTNGEGLKRCVRGAFYGLDNLLERFALDLVAHFRGHDDANLAGHGAVTILAGLNSVTITQTAVRRSERTSETAF